MCNALNLIPSTTKIIQFQVIIFTTRNKRRMMRNAKLHEVVKTSLKRVISADKGVSRGCWRESIPGGNCICYFLRQK
jgi:hypothetical protein